MQPDTIFKNIKYRRIAPIMWQGILPDEIEIKNQENCLNHISRLTEKVYFWIVKKFILFVFAFPLTIYTGNEALPRLLNVI